MLNQVTDPVALLVACHERIRSFVTTAARIASAPTVPPSQIADAAMRIHRYFTIALPLHEEDEELSMTMRLREARASSEVDDALGTMAMQHTALHAILSELDASWYSLSTQPEQVVSLAPKMSQAQRALEELFEIHLSMEEQIIFPAIKRLLAPSVQEGLLAEMRARRTPEVMARLG